MACKHQPKRATSCLRALKRRDRGSTARRPTICLACGEVVAANEARAHPRERNCGGVFFDLEEGVLVCVRCMNGAEPHNEMADYGVIVQPNGKRIQEAVGTIQDWLEKIGDELFTMEEEEEDEQGERESPSPNLSKRKKPKHNNSKRDVDKRKQKQEVGGANPVKKKVDDCQASLEEISAKLKDLDLHKGSLVHGIANVGNSCYMNACIQCLAHAPLLQESIQNVLLKRVEEEEVWEINELVWPLGKDSNEPWLAFTAPLRETIDAQTVLTQLFGGSTRANTLIVSVQLLPAQGELALALSFIDAVGINGALAVYSTNQGQDLGLPGRGSNTIFRGGRWSLDVLPNQPPANLSLPALGTLPLGSDGIINVTAETAELYGKDLLYNKLLPAMGLASFLLTNDAAPPPSLNFVDIDGDGALDLFAVMKGGILAFKGSASATFEFDLNPFAPGTTVFPRTWDGDGANLPSADASVAQDWELYYQVFDLGKRVGLAGPPKTIVQSVTTLDVDEDGFPELITWATGQQALALFKPIQTSNGLYQYDPKPVPVIIDADSKALITTSGSDLASQDLSLSTLGTIAALQSASYGPLLYVNGRFFQLDREGPLGANSGVRVRLVQGNNAETDFFTNFTNWHDTVYKFQPKGPILRSCAVSFKNDIDGDSLYDGVAFRSEGFEYDDDPNGLSNPPSATLRLAWHPTATPGIIVEGEILLSSLLPSQVVSDFRATSSSSYCPRLVDTDGDGDLDLVLSIQINADNAAPILFVFRNDDDGGPVTFTKWSLSTLNPFLQQDLQAISGALIPEIVDMDNDGDLDVLAFVDVRTMRAPGQAFLYFQNIALDCSSGCMAGRGECAQSRAVRANVLIPELQDSSTSSAQAAGGRCLCYEPFAGNACEQCAPNYFGLNCAERCPRHAQTFLEPGELVYPNGPTLEHCRCVPPFVRVNATGDESFSCACPPGYGYDQAFDACFIVEKGFFSATTALEPATSCREYFTTEGLGATSELDCICQDTFVLTQYPDGARECTCPEDKLLDEELGFCIPVPTSPETDLVLLSASAAGAALLSFMLVCCCVNRKQIPYVMPIRLPFGCTHYFFISYKQSTGMDYAQGIYQALRKRGCSAWMDQYQSEVNFNEMVRGVQASAMYVLVLSEGVLDSKAVMLELATAVQYHKPIMLCHAKGFPFSSALANFDGSQNAGEIVRKLFQAINSIQAPSSDCNRNDAKRFFAEVIRVYQAKKGRTYEKISRKLLKSEVETLSLHFSPEKHSADGKVVPHL